MSTDSAADGRPYANRFDRLLQRMSGFAVDGVLVTSPANRRYLSGFTGSSANLVITQDRRLLITDGRYATQAKAQAPAFQAIIHSGAILDQVARSVVEAKVKRLGIDPGHITVADHRKLAGALAGGCELVDTPGLVEGLRLVKDEQELSVLRRSIAVADAVMETVNEIVRPGASEIEVAIRIEAEFRHSGAAGPSFPVIVAAGSNAAMPHHSPTNRVMKNGDTVVVDMGAVVDGYCSDMTRTFCAGGADSKFSEIYAIVLEAQLAAIREVRDGLKAKDCDRAARDVIEAAGYGDQFSHGTGHGVGLEIHEAPRVSRTSEDTLLVGMVHSVEPGIYLPEWGGVRIEDLVLVTENGAEVLSQFRK